VSSPLLRCASERFSEREFRFSSQFGRSTPARVGAVEGGLWVAQGGPDVASVLSWKCISPTPTRERASVRPLQVVPGLRAPRDVRGQRWTLGRARVDLRTRGRRISCDHALLGGCPRVIDRVRGAASRVDLTSRVAPDGKCVLPSPQGVELGSRRVDRRSRFEPADPNERRAGHGGPQVAVAGAASTPMRLAAVTAPASRHYLECESVPRWV